MYIIQYNVEDALMKEVKLRLETLSLAYKLEKVDAATKTSLQYSGTTWSDKHSIMEHLTQTEEELKKWHYCNC